MLFKSHLSLLHKHCCQDFLAEVTSVGLQTQYEAVCENLGLIAYLVQVLVIQLVIHLVQVLVILVTTSVLTSLFQCEPSADL